MKQDDQQADTRTFDFDGATYTAAQMLAANAHDDDVCTWVASAKPGDVYVGIVPVECREVTQ